MQILDLGCQPPSNVLEVTLHNELNPNVTCARWLVPNWADQLAEKGTAVTIDKETGGTCICGGKGERGKGKGWGNVEPCVCVQCLSQHSRNRTNPPTNHRGDGRAGRKHRRARAPR